MSMSKRALQRYFLTGLLTALPLWLTWVVFEFVLRQLSRFGTPWVEAFAGRLSGFAPGVANFLRDPWVMSALAALLTVVAICLLGWLAQAVIGRRILEGFEQLIARIPFVQTIYGSVKRLITVLQQKPEGAQRVVLIEFPSPEMKTVGLVTRVFRDSVTGRELAAVYVPTTPNPTSGYLEIVPVDKLVPTNWTMDEAMTFIISGGAIAPETIRYDRDPEA
jgi:uncharacterized membrane protein